MEWKAEGGDSLEGRDRVRAVLCCAVLQKCGDRAEAERVPRTPRGWRRRAFKNDTKETETKGTFGGRRFDSGWGMEV